VYVSEWEWEVGFREGKVCVGVRFCKEQSLIMKNIAIKQ